jgi:Flp pilus assembly pilin Flp
MMNTFKTFLSNDSGAVTVDWVVLTAAIVGLGLAVITSVRSGVQALGSDISTSLTSASVVSLGTLGSN